MGWYVSRNGETVGPVDDDTVIDWIGKGMRNATVCDEHGGAWTPIAQSPFGIIISRQPAPGMSGCGLAAVVLLVGGVLLGGCSFIVIEPVIALAIFFVGIPFVLFVLWVSGAIWGPKN